MRGEINSKLKNEVFVQMGEGEDAKGNPIVVAPKVSALFGYEKHPQAGENLTAKVMSAADVQAVKAADQDVFNTYYTCSLKDLTSLNIAATSLGMPLWEVKQSSALVTEQMVGAQIAFGNITDAANAVGQLLKMATDEMTMPRGEKVLELSRDTLAGAA